MAKESCLKLGFNLFVLLELFCMTVGFGFNLIILQGVSCSSVCGSVSILSCHSASCLSWNCWTRMVVVTQDNFFISWIKGLYDFVKF